MRFCGIFSLIHFLLRLLCLDYYDDNIACIRGYAKTAPSYGVISGLIARRYSFTHPQPTVLQFTVT